MTDLPVHVLVALAGFAAGIAFGATAQRTNFCTMGAISDAVLVGSHSRMRAWALATAVAILGSQALHLAGIVDLNQSIYLTPNLGWAGAVLGGALFGFGMTLAGGCGSKTLVRLGAGSLKSLIVFLVLGLSAYATVRGLFAVPRARLEELTNANLAKLAVPRQGVPDLLAKLTGIGVGPLRAALALAVAGAFLVYCFRDAAFRASRRDIAAGAIVGLLVPAGWLITGVLGKDEFDPTPLASFTYVAPSGDMLQYLMTFTGAKIGFGVALGFGTIAGAFLAAVAAREFQFEAFAGAPDMLRHLAGGAMMGVGGVLALGCTIGQGITGMSTLALGSVLAWLSILAGGYLGIKYLDRGSLAGAFRAVFARG
jgi:uncharacterized membrane protein YedE/YeeE